MSEPRVTVGLFRMLLASGAACGMPRAELLDLVGKTDADLVDPDAPIPLTVHLTVARAIIAANPGVNLGLVALRHSGRGTLGVLGYAISHSATLRDAIRLFVRYQMLLTDAASWRLVGNRLLVSCHPALRELSHPIEHMMAMWVRLGHRLTGKPIIPTAVTFAHAPLGDPAEHAAAFGIAPDFEAEENALHLPDEALDLPIQGARLELQPGLVALLHTRLPEEVGGETTRAVESALREMLPGGVSDKDAVARRLGVSARTLSRRLKAEGTRYQDVLDGVRSQLAQHWLKSSSMAVYEVAFMLGFAETSTFHRAFRRWTGAAPANWRAVHRPAG